MATFWDIIASIAPIIVPLVGAIVGVFRNFHRRLLELERSKVRFGRALFGDEDDPQQTGLSRDLNTVDEEIDSIEDRIGSIEYELDQIERRLNRIEDRVSDIRDDL